MSQIHGLLPTESHGKDGLPSLRDVWLWIDARTLYAIELIEKEADGEVLSTEELFEIQSAIIARLVCARDLPCVRLSILKNILRPGIKIKCKVEGCMKEGCEGNVCTSKIEGGVTSFKFFARHHKVGGVEDASTRVLTLICCRTQARRAARARAP